MKKDPLEKKVTLSQQTTPWSLGDKFLYELCKKHFEHKSAEEILAKTLLIGRAYAVAIERRKIKKTMPNDQWFLEVVVPLFLKSELDDRLAYLRAQNLSFKTIKEVLETHSYLTSILFDITQLNKRSFSSKYLHFHLPNLFFLYDSRAVTSMRSFVKSLPAEYNQFLTLVDADKQYSNFACKCLHLRQEIQTNFNIKLAPRELDNLLIR